MDEDAALLADCLCWFTDDEEVIESSILIMVEPNAFMSNITAVQPTCVS